MADVRAYLVPEGLEGQRVDVALSRLLGFSRSAAAEIISDGGLLLGGRAAIKSDTVRAGMMLEVTMPEVSAPSAPQPVEGMGILFEDEHVVVVDKPVGVAAHSSPGWSGPTVIGALAAAGHRISTSGPPERQGIVHRLDVGTSGVMMVAKSELAYSRLKRAFRNRTVEKIYHALVQGHPSPSIGTVDAPIGRHPGGTYKMAVIAGGRASVTHYETIEATRGASLLEIHLETGRTHQIRVHMSALRHPCVGDVTYGGDPRLAEELGLIRQWLHAVELGFEHPSSGEWVSVKCDYAEDLKHALELVRNPA